MEIDLDAPQIGVEFMAPPGMEELTGQLQNMFSNLHGGKTRSMRLKIGDALRRLREEEAMKLVNEDELKTRAVDAVEQTGIVFLDELDKVAKRSESVGADVSREGVQRDLLPLIEGCTVNTKYGMVRTDHILFIASGAFHFAKPSDLIPELQGRLPIRVELSALTAADFRAHPVGAGCLADAAVQGVAGDRRHRHRVHRRGAGPDRGDLLRGEREHGEYRRSPPAHGHGKAARRDLVPEPARVARSPSTRLTSTITWRISPRTRICRAIFSSRATLRSVR